MLFDFDEIHVKQNQLPIKKVIKITNEPVVVVICNSLAYYRAGLSLKRCNVILTLLVTELLSLKE